MTDVHIEGTRPPGWWRVLAAPWLGIVRPAAAAERLIAAPGRRFWVAYALHAVALAAAVVLLLILDATVRLTWVPPTTLPGSAPASNVAALGWSSEISTRSVAEVWQAWHADGLIGPAELIFLTVLGLVCVGTALLAWLNLPRLHRSGPVALVFAQALRGIAVGGGLLMLSTVVIGLFLVYFSHAQRLGTGSPEFGIAVLAAAGIPLGIIFNLERIQRAITRVGDQPFALHLPPRCAGCGYDLSHQPADGRCPECAAGVAESLRPEHRPGIAWERERGRRFGRWLQAGLDVLLKPRTFYARLRLRNPPRAASGFAVRHYVCIGVATTCWVLLMFGISGEWTDSQEIVLATLAAALYTPLVCWFGHRLGGALVISWWIVRRFLPDTRWAAKVVDYEAAFLWAFGAFWCLLATSLVVAGAPWITDRFGSAFFFAVFGMPGEVVVVLGGTGLLAFVWLWRYRLALRAIRWSNF